MERNSPIIDKILIFTLFVFTASSMFSISISQITAGLGGGLWLLRTYLADTWKEQRWPLVIPFILFVLACFIAVANAYDASYSYKSLKKLLEVLIFFWVLNCVRDTNLRNSLILVLIASATIVSLFGFFQAMRESGLVLNPLGVRPQGTQNNYMTFSGLLMMVNIIALAYAIFFQSTQKWVLASIGIIFYCLLLTLTRQAWLGLFVGLVFLVFLWKKKFLLFLPLLLVIIFLISPISTKYRITETLRPIISTMLFKKNNSYYQSLPVDECSERKLGIHCSVDLIWTERANNRLELVPKGVMRDNTRHRVKNYALRKRIKEITLEVYEAGIHKHERDRTLASRINLWQFGWKVFKDYPLTGCGFSCVDLIHNQYIDPFPQYFGSVRHLRGMHNNFIQITVDTGILGLSTWLGIWACFFWLLYRKATNLKPDSSERSVIFGSAAAVIAFHTGGLFETNFYDSEIAMLLYFIMALPFAGTQNIPKSTIKKIV
jgi:hypothetical protein